jgi:hypothetical protein
MRPRTGSFFSIAVVILLLLVIIVLGQGYRLELILGYRGLPVWRKSERHQTRITMKKIGAI